MSVKTREVLRNTSHDIAPKCDKDVLLQEIGLIETQLLILLPNTTFCLELREQPVTTIGFDIYNYQQPLIILAFTTIESPICDNYQQICNLFARFGWQIFKVGDQQLIFKKLLAK